MCYNARIRTAEEPELFFFKGEKMKFFALIDLRKAKKFNLNVQEGLVIEYLFQFFKSGRMKRKRIENKVYYLITYDKILQDLSILDIQKRRLGVILKSLAEKNMFQKAPDMANQLYITFENSPYLHFKWEPKITSSKAPSMVEIRTRYRGRLSSMRQNAEEEDLEEAETGGFRPKTYEEARQRIADIFDGKFRK